ncbi:MAG: hypothetical protein JWN50_381 [Parcubacteria group bacterium]|nr:hypothetical protein [Parcubacteria group bacterium]
MSAKPRVTEEAITVKIGAFPGGQIKSYTVPQGSTYLDGLKKAGLGGTGNSESLDIRVNGAKISSTAAPMQEGDQILLFSKVRGN